MPTRSQHAARRGAAALDPLVVYVVLLPVLVPLQDWYVDASAPGCPTGGSGTQSDPYCRVQDAVNAAADGDTIRIAPGTYLENVVIDKDLDLVGTGGQEVTLLDGTASGSVVHVMDSVVTLTGLTLTNGTGTTSYSGDTYGGGLLASSTIGGDSLPRVRLTSCTISSNSAYYGGGLACEAADSLLELIDSLVTGNSAEFGGGIQADTVVLISSSVIGNTAGSDGGGIGAIHVSTTACTIAQNQAGSNPGSGFGVGGGIYIPGLAGPVSPPQYLILTNSTVSENLAGSSIRGFGGGIYSAAPVCAIADSTVSGNVAMSASAFSLGVAGGILSAGDSMTITNSVVSDNSADGGSSSGILTQGAVTMTNSTVTGHDATGIEVDPMGSANVSNCILWDSYPLDVYGSVSVDHSLVQGGWPGVGNIDADPLFFDPLHGDLRLKLGSPCIDAGDNSAVPTGIVTDRRGFPRFYDDLGTPDSGVGPAPVVDMGAFEFGHLNRIRRR
jgi:hypothetical protein